MHIRLVIYYVPDHHRPVGDPSTFLNYSTVHTPFRHQASDYRKYYITLETTRPAQNRHSESTSKPFAPVDANPNPALQVATCNEKELRRCATSTGHLSREFVCLSNKHGGDFNVDGSDHAPRARPARRTRRVVSRRSSHRDHTLPHAAVRSRRKRCHGPQGRQVVPRRRGGGRQRHRRVSDGAPHVHLDDAQTRAQARRSDAESHP